MGNFYKITIFILLLFGGTGTKAQHSVARQWNEALLHAIRHDFARPTVHARNLWHTSVAMYDSWAVYTNAAEPFFLGDSLGSYYCPFSDTALARPVSIKAAQEETMSYAAYRLLKHRFQNSPGASTSLTYFDSLFLHLGYDPAITGANYATGGPAELGNFIAQEMIAFGYTDSANEQGGYANQFYSPVNPTLAPIAPGNPNVVDPNRWQPLTLNVYVDQSGNVIPISTPDFLSPEWGSVVPFALHDSIKSTFTRNGNSYNVFHSLPQPPYLGTANGGPPSEQYKWGFRMVSKWSSHLDTSDAVMVDISPGNIGNVNWYPSGHDSLPHFYDEDFGGDIGQGHAVNPRTGQPYTPQMVRRGDYTRVLAEFWADGPDSETPPGHWFTILNYVNDQPQLEKKWRGTGPVLDDLEWDVKCYFTLAGAVHDAAVAAWAAKGWYDYTRPISAIRYMASQGQSTDSTLPSYSPNGIQLDSGFVELVDSADALAGSNYENVGKIKVYAWKGPDYISDPLTDMAGVGWILAENWWPYQRPTFVTPPFAGYVSGHSTFSRAAAEVLTMITDDPYFPGGMGEFLAEKNEFLVFEEGPTQNVTLQWATYRDASDQCSLSRIWGGIHPPADDIPGRLMGIKVGQHAFDLARTYWENGLPDVIDLTVNLNTITDSLDGTSAFSITVKYDGEMDTTSAPAITFPTENPSLTLSLDSVLSGWSSPYSYESFYHIVDSDEKIFDIDIRVNGAMGTDNNAQQQFDAVDQFSIEMQNPQVLSLSVSPQALADANTGTDALRMTATFSEPMDTSFAPVLSFPQDDPLQKSLNENTVATAWLDSLNYRFSYDLVDSNESLRNIAVAVASSRDLFHNETEPRVFPGHFILDTENPVLMDIAMPADTIDRNHIGTGSFQLLLTFSENMDTSLAPYISFPVEDPLASSLTFNTSASQWIDSRSYRASYDVDSSLNQLHNIDVDVDLGADSLGNPQIQWKGPDVFHIDIKSGLELVLLRRREALAVFPNPVRRGEEVQLSGTTKLTAVELLDMRGRVVLRQQISQGERKSTIATSSLVPGTYMLVLKGETGQENYKLVVN